MIETLVTYVSAHTRVKVLRIAASAMAIGISTAGNVPNTNSRIDERAESSDHCFQQDARPPARTMGTRFLERVVARHVDGDPGREAGGSRGAHLLCAALLIQPALGRAGRPPRRSCAGRARRREGCRVEKYELVRAPGIVAAARCIARSIARLLVASPLLRKTTTFGARTPTPKAASVRWLAS